MMKNDRLTWWYWWIVTDRTTERTLQLKIKERKNMKKLDHMSEVTR